MLPHTGTHYTYGCTDVMNHIPLCTLQICIGIEFVYVGFWLWLCLCVWLCVRVLACAYLSYIFSYIVLCNRYSHIKQCSITFPYSKTIELHIIVYISQENGTLRVNTNLILFHLMQHISNKICCNKDNILFIIFILPIVKWFDWTTIYST